MSVPQLGAVHGTPLDVLKTARLTSRADPVERAATGRLALAQEK